MNYKKIYYDIIDRAKGLNRTKTDESYYENHHIMPRCMGGDNSELNLVLLTAREHFICHVLLTRMFPKEGKLLCAVNYMMNDNGYGRNENLSKSRLYELYRVKYSEYLRQTRMVIGEDGDCFRVDKDDPRIQSGELKHLMTVKRTVGLKYITKDGIDRRVPEEELGIYISDGWERGTSISSEFYSSMTKGKKRINNGVTETNVDVNDIPQYIESGWVLGSLSSSTKDTVWINKYCSNKMVSKSELDSFLNDKWVLGMYRKDKSNSKIAIHNGTREKRIPPAELSKFLNEGWQRGRLCKTNKGRKWMWLDGHKKAVDPKDITSYRNDGWRFYNEL